MRFASQMRFDVLITVNITAALISTVVTFRNMPACNPRQRRHYFDFGKRKQKQAEGKNLGGITPANEDDKFIVDNLF